MAWCTPRAALPVMRERKSGYIFQVSSVGGRHAVPGNTPYHAAKWALGGFSDSLAMEVALFGVKVCTLGSVGSLLKILQGLKGHLVSDPRKIADVIRQLANSDEVPVRLILGFDAERRVQHVEGARARPEKWR
jgi:NAD(P)-dependent dehydrogenase (short-subunit alcohol dehydrogenase family)